VERWRPARAGVGDRHRNSGRLHGDRLDNFSRAMTTLVSICRRTLAAAAIVVGLGAADCASTAFTPMDANSFRALPPWRLPYRRPDLTADGTDICEQAWQPRALAAIAAFEQKKQREQQAAQRGL